MLGSSKGMYQIVHCYEDGKGVKVDWKEVYIHYRKSSEMGYSDGTYSVCCCYQSGFGTQQDESRAFVNYLKLSEIEHPLAEMEYLEAIIDLNIFYEFGIGVKKEVYEAFICYQKLDEIGDSNGTYRLGISSADMGSNNGEYKVGNCYRKRIGVEKKTEKRIKISRLNITKNQLKKEMLMNGRCYENGIGIQPNIQVALTYYKTSAYMGHEYALEGQEIEEYVKLVDRSMRAMDIEDRKRDNYTLGNLNENEKKRMGTNSWKKLRSPVYGNCGNCNRDNTSPVWCLTSMTYVKAIEWIPYDRLINVKFIGEGAFGSIFSATWLNGHENLVAIIMNINPSCVVALKTLSDPDKDPYFFLKELKDSVRCRMKSSKLHIYGLTRDSHNKYLMVFQYVSQGSLHEFLKSKIKNLKWRNKLDLLVGLGYSRKNNTYIKEGKIIGMIPYIASEVLSGTSPHQRLTFIALVPSWQKRDSYCYVELAKQCMDSDPQKRPNQDSKALEAQ
ncbi:hypothetical protein C2G38_2183829 [Gigaspora rosea]|uniref:Serine-threonine/tyrosine-protein kinase catalytic domain-containing protein n=1 Tax=Gigaspora rosea TaxID=44941 RepID=A0A397V8G9_9GLOM|nr:hypothetical protein C2G38_2183829 [Gigaspora rosea]